MIRWRLVAGAFLGLLPIAAAAKSEPYEVEEEVVAIEDSAATVEEAEFSVAVVPFESVAPPGMDVPDVAQLLADRLGTRGVDRVIGPAAPGAPAAGQGVGDGDLAWAAGQQADVFVVGRVTRLGSRISVDLKVRSAQSGEVLSSHVAEAARADELGAALDRLAAEIVATTPIGETPPPVAAGASADSGSEAAFFSFGASASGEPMSIQAEELEAIDDGGERRFVFERNVRVRQGNLRLTSNHLEAHYPPGADEPDRLIATGDVALQQDEKRARCDVVEYRRSEDRVLCRGNAELRQGQDVVRGKEIEFLLASERLRVLGGAEVQIGPRDSNSAGAP